jgi:hypothetical protein
MEEQVEQNQDDCRDTHNPCQEIFTHDVLLSMVCSDDGSIMRWAGGLVRTLNHKCKHAPVPLD